MARDWALVAKLAKLPDDTLVGVEEVAALTGFAPSTIRSKRLEGLTPIKQSRYLRWRLGQIRNWGNPEKVEDGLSAPQKEVGQPKRKAGHPRLPANNTILFSR
ncbi:helix-turn-helix transcriptional regulator [Herbaspirillum frisingense]|uniref:helix-turn-helix transcriptional regulator n=1 Tax=Herbaspirillum frisingense TaxID=92645 RepID=UPI0039B042A0